MPAMRLSSPISSMAASNSCSKKRFAVRCRIATTRSTSTSIRTLVASKTGSFLPSREITSSWLEMSSKVSTASATPTHAYFRSERIRLRSCLLQRRQTTRTTYSICPPIFAARLKLSISSTRSSALSSRAKRPRLNTIKTTS